MITRLTSLIGLLGACSGAAGARVGVDVDTHGQVRATGSVEPAWGLSRYPAQEDVATQTGTTTLLTIGAGWGAPGGPFLVVGLGVVVVPGGDGAGGLGGVRLELDERCHRFRVEGGAVARIAQLHAEDGGTDCPNGLCASPLTTRVDHAVSLELGGHWCRESDDAFELGAAYRIQIQKDFTDVPIGY